MYCSMKYIYRVSHAFLKRLANMRTVTNIFSGSSLSAAEAFGRDVFQIKWDAMCYICKRLHNFSVIVFVTGVSYLSVRLMITQLDRNM